MKFLVVNTDYPAFLRWLYEKNGELEKRSYEDQMEARVASLNSEADFYSRNLHKLGQEAWDIYANNDFLQGLHAGIQGQKLPDGD